MAERLRTGGQHARSGSVRFDRVTAGRFHPLARAVPGPNGVQVSFPELPEPRADGVEPGIDLPSATSLGPRVPAPAREHAPPGRRGTRHLGILLSSCST